MDLKKHFLKVPVSTSIYWFPFNKIPFYSFLYVSVLNDFHQKRLTVHYYRVNYSATHGYFCESSWLLMGDWTTIVFLNFTGLTYRTSIYRSLSVSQYCTSDLLFVGLFFDFVFSLFFTGRAALSCWVEEVCRSLTWQRKTLAYTLAWRTTSMHPLKPRLSSQWMVK